MAAFDQDFAKDTVMIMAAPNGARRTRKDHPAVPLTAAELAECAATLADAGVSILHLHVRDAEARHSLDVGLYRQAIDAIRSRVGEKLVLQVTTEAVGRYSPDQQMAMVRELKPEAVSLSLRELIPTDEDEARATEFFAWLVENDIWPQYILYTADDVRRFDTLRRRGMFATERPFCLLVLGRYSERLEGQPAELGALLDAADFADIPWAACCFGRHENTVMVDATRVGGHVRIGFENNLILCDGTPARDNAALINQYLASVAHLERRPATADEIRAEWRQ